MFEEFNLNDISVSFGKLKVFPLEIFNNQCVVLKKKKNPIYLGLELHHLLLLHLFPLPGGLAFRFHLFHQVDALLLQVLDLVRQALAVLGRGLFHLQ